jgi:hypothetical protein
MPTIVAKVRPSLNPTHAGVLQTERVDERRDVVGKEVVGDGPTGVSGPARDCADERPPQLEHERPRVEQPESRRASVHIGHATTMKHSSRRSIGELTYFGSGLIGLRTSPLRQDRGNVVLDRLARHEQAVGDLWVGHALGQQPQHLLLALSRSDTAPRPG